MAVQRLLESERGAPGMGAPALGGGVERRVLRRLSASRWGAGAHIAGRRLDGLLQPAQRPRGRTGSAVSKLERPVGRVPNHVSTLGLALDEPQAALRGLPGRLLNSRHIDHSLVVLLTLRVIITRTDASRQAARSLSISDWAKPPKTS